MKVIAVSNFNNETMSDILVCENVNQYWGERIVEMFNRAAGEHSARFYRLVPDDHVLYVWEP